MRTIADAVGTVAAVVVGSVAVVVVSTAAAADGIVEVAADSVAWLECSWSVAVVAAAGICGLVGVAVGMMSCVIVCGPCYCYYIGVVGDATD